MRFILLLMALLLAVPVAYSAGKVPPNLSLRLKQNVLAAVTVGLSLWATIAPVAAGDDAVANQEQEEKVEQEPVADGIEEIAEDMPEEEAVWFELKTHPLAHRRAVFYLLIDMFEHWRVVHVNYVGDDHDGEPLFVGLRTYTRVGDDPAFRFAMTALVGHEGLVQENIDVEEVEFFPSKASIPYFDITLLKINGLNMSDYKPIRMTRHVKLFADVEMLSYRVDLADNLLEYFDYPLRFRNCKSRNIVTVDNQKMILNNCSIPYTPAVTGSPVFSDKNELIGLYVGWTDPGNHLAVTMPKALLDLSSYAISKRDKLPIMWGELKK